MNYSTSKKQSCKTSLARFCFLVLAFLMIQLCLVGKAHSIEENELISVNAFNALPEVNYRTNNTLTLSGERFSNASISINGQLRVTEGLGAWEIEFILEQGQHEFSIQAQSSDGFTVEPINICLLYTSPSPRDQRGSRMPSSA